MNAYSSIKERHSRNALVRRVRSKAWRAGLIQGLGAPALLFFPSSHARATAIDVTIAGAWNAVGKALKGAETVERGKIGKSTGKVDID